MKAYAAGMLVLAMVLAAVTVVSPRSRPDTDGTGRGPYSECRPESALGWQVRRLWRQAVSPRMKSGV